MTTKANNGTAAAPAAGSDLRVTLTLGKETKGTVVYNSEQVPTVYVPKPILNGKRPATIEVIIPGAGV